MNELNYAIRFGYSDVHPFEVVRRVSDKTIEVRAMSAKIDPEWKPEFVAGGFAAHCVNQDEQRWIIESDEEAKVVRIRLGKRGWKDKNGNQYKLRDKPVKFHDYNF